VGLPPYISIVSVWQQRRPIVTDLSACRHRLLIETSSFRTVGLADLATAIPRNSYLFEVSWPNVRRTLLVACALFEKSLNLRGLACAFRGHPSRSIVCIIMPPQRMSVKNKICST
jgi:hypothetical protein